LSPQIHREIFPFFQSSYQALMCRIPGAIDHTIEQQPLPHPEFFGYTFG
jgi:hypothetical protein